MQNYVFMAEVYSILFKHIFEWESESFLTENGPYLNLTPN